MNTLLLLAPLAAPGLAAATYLALGWRRVTAHVATAASAVILADAIALAVHVVRHGPIGAASGWLHADALSSFMLLGIGTIALIAAAASPGYLASHEGEHEHEPGRSGRRYGVLVCLFLAAMATAVLAGNLGLAWIAIEATTIVTAFLVGHTGSRTALEAAWKYTVICSTGIALALLGLVMLYDAARHANLAETDALNYTLLTSRAHALDPGVLRMAVAFLLLGFGAKAGLAPLHSWLPDAHSQAPAPVSALMSGVLLPVALSQILRVTAIANPALGPGYTRTLLTVMGLGTLLLAAIALIRQRDYKRMLAYSSMEHMGLIAIGAAIGTPLALAAILLHIAGHGLAKAVAFTSAGHILATEHTTGIEDIKALTRRQPVLAGIFAAALLALLGFPPFSLFVSELALARAGFAAHLGLVIAAALVLLLIAFAALAHHGGRMLLGAADEDTPAPALSTLTYPPLITALVVLAALGITAYPISALLNAAAGVGH
ncbi:MAG TPA: proton-conducting transporter membrane subunit [Actinospica sp.]|nr:proton-conducting transporter membrane subunit [Actinospica sp.]